MALLLTVGVPGDLLVIFPLDEAQAREAARLRPSTRAAGLSLGDRACLALAASLKLPVLTADRAWAGLQVGVVVELIR
jgi:ribonuclease VapC